MKPRGGCEFMADFALQMPIIVFLRLVDLPASDRERLLEIATGIVAPDEGELRDTAMQKMFAYLRPIIAERVARSEEHTSELQSLMRISYAVFCLNTQMTPRQIRSPNLCTRDGRR